MKPRAYRWLRWRGLRLGWPGALGLGLLAGCLAAYFVLVQPAQQRLQQARLAASSLQERIARAGDDAKNKPQSLQDQLDAFYRIFPNERQAADWVGKIAVIAQRDGLSLHQAEYRATPDKTGKLARLQMSLPLKGDYQIVRRFLSDLRAEVPIVAVEQVQLERQKVGDASVDARVRLVIFLGRSS
jgi:Tfp pilus assembly protein PilO